ncbi:MAG: acetyl-CoA carboxylase biotin carboxyl carrier protein [Microbacteriaceae bacterium]|nr:acetyl-CoA carboxylase biotin carboxyl carrier protein [Microbacteriaceae bacterium]
MSLNPPDIAELKAIVDWVNLTEDVRELSIKFDSVELFISRDRTSSSTAPAAVAPTAAPSAAPVAPAVAAAAVPAPVAAPAPAPASSANGGGFSEDSLAADEVVVKAPMVGVFYAAPKPGDPAFVTVGDAVTTSTVVGIVEVMKLMNNLEAKVEGTVVRILVENENPVEYGQPLMVIKRNG